MLQFRADKSPASNQEWRAWGESDPLYGVATVPERSRNGAQPWTDEAFYALGAADWDLFRSKWEQYGLTYGTCVEIGCGAGRITLQLARHFKSVHGVDISSGMIEYARRRLPANVALHLTTGTDIALPDQTADAIFSTHVLQHLSSTSAAAAYFHEMGRVLRPGGTMMVHVPIIAWPWGTLVGVHKVVHAIKGVLDGYRAQLQRYMFSRGFAATPPMQVTWYEVSWLYRTLKGCGLGDIEIRVLLGGSEMAVQHPFIFARKGVAADRLAQNA